MSARKSIIPVFIPHLGCPHDCVFCNQKRISGSLLPAGADDVKRAIEGGLSHCAAPAQLAFYGGSFTAIPAPEQEALLSAAEPYLKSGLISDIRLSTRPDAIDTDILDRLRKYGVSTVELGAQSMSDRVLGLSGRGHSAQDTVRASKLIKESGFKLILQMMTGLPGSNDESDIETARCVIALRPDGVRIYPTVIIRDTAMYDMWRAGRYKEHTVEDAVRLCAEILPMFERAGINVIRLGLNPTDDLSGGDAAAGAYHPALGELVRSRIMLNRARELLKSGNTYMPFHNQMCEERTVNNEPERKLILAVAPGKVSQMVGQKRCNIQALKNEFGFDDIKVIEKAMPDGEVVAVSVAR